MNKLWVLLKLDKWGSYDDWEWPLGRISRRDYLSSSIAVFAPGRPRSRKRIWR